MDGGTRADAKRTKSTAPSDPVSGDAVDTSPRCVRRGEVHDLLHVRVPVRDQGASEGRPDPVHRGQPEPSGEPRRAVRQGLGGDHAAVLAGEADGSRCCGWASAARASSGRSSGTRRWRWRREWLGAIRASDPRKLAFFTGRDQSQSLTGWWAAQFGTPNFAAHGGFCSVNMAAAGLYSIGGSFWEFGEPDWERTRYFLMFGVAEDHDSNPIKLGIVQAEGARRQVRVGQPGADRLLGGRRRVGRRSGRARTGCW